MTVDGDQKNAHNGDLKHARSPRSSPSSDDFSPKRASLATTASYHTAPGGKSSSDTQYYTGRDSSERSSPSRDRVYDPTRNSYIPRDPECPIHSPKGGGSQRSSPARCTPTRDSPTRSMHFSRNSPTRITPPRISPNRSSSFSRVSPNRVTPPRTPPTTSLSPRGSAVHKSASRSSSVEVHEPMGPVHPSRASAAQIELLHCTICTRQFRNPKVTMLRHKYNNKNSNVHRS